MDKDQVATILDEIGILLELQGENPFRCGAYYKAARAISQLETNLGDIVTAGQDGWFYVADRVKELIKYKAYQVAPAELEALLLTHPAVADAAVVRKRDTLAGEVPKAFVVLRTPVSADDLMAWVGERVAGYKRVRQIEFTDHIPRSPAGKILRRLLVERDAGP